MQPAVLPDYEQLEQRLAAWAEAQPDVRAVLVIGSRSRTIRPADAWSDLDCILFVDDSGRYTQSGIWQRALEAALDWPIWFSAFGMAAQVDPEWETVLEGGRKVDLVFSQNRAGSGANLNAMVAAAPFYGVFQDGARVLVDKSDPPQPFQPPAPRAAPAPPSQAEFDNRFANLLLDLVRAAKLARRGELWRAARAVNEEAQQSLLTLIQWHAQSAGRPGADRWTYGRFLEEWADPRALAALLAVYAVPSLPAVRGALHACLDLLSWLGPETAGLLGLRFPDGAVRPSADWLRQILTDD